MFVRRTFKTLFALGALAAMSVIISAAQVPSNEEIAATARWFDGLAWPDLRGKPYVEIVFGDGDFETKMKDRPRVRGFLLSEDEKAFTVFSDGTVAQSGFFTGGGWPFVVQRIPKSPPAAEANSQVTERVIELTAAVDEMLAKFNRPKDENEARISHFGRKTTDRTAAFVLARCCGMQGRPDLADRLDSALVKLGSADMQRPGSVEVAFQVAVQKEIAHALMWKGVVDCGDASVTRPELLAQFERIVGDFPESEHHVRAVSFTEMLRTMIAEDETHARTSKPFDAMNDDEKARELIFRLRDQNGHQFSQPGSCDVFGDFGFAKHGDSPAHQLVKFGHPAVPALIEALGDKRLSHSVGFQRDFFFSHFVLTVGDCAEAVLARIAGRNFWVAYTTSASMQKDGQTTATRRAIEAWWRGVRGKGGKAMLIKGVRAGGDDSLEQARRLTALDPGASLTALAVGIRAAKSHWVRRWLVEAIAEIKTDAAAMALRREMKQCASLHGRVAAATELFRRGENDTVLAMIGEWKKWKPSPRDAWDDDAEDADPLIAFLGTCGDLAAMKALADRFPSLPADVKFKVIEVVTETGVLHEVERVRDENAALPAVVEALGEEIAASALSDRTVQHGTSGNLGEIDYWDPRVCDLAAWSLAERWPERYSFKWSATRIERDPQIVHAANVWRAAHAMKALPIPERPSHASAATEPNVVAECNWYGGKALPPVPIAIGQPLNADLLLKLIIQLHRALPKGFVGFSLSAERPGDLHGFVVEIEWRRGSRPKSGGGWDHSINILLGDEALLSGGGGKSYEEPADSSDYEDERSAMTKALGGGADQPIVIYFSTRLSSD